MILERERRELFRQAAESPVLGLPSTFGSRLEADANEWLRTAWSFSRANARAEVMQRFLDRYEDETGRSLPNPEANVEHRERLYGMVANDVEEYRRANPGFLLRAPTEDELEAGAVEIARGAMTAAERERARPQTFWSGAGGFTGSLAAAAADPVNVISMPFGTAAGRGVIGRMLSWAGVGAAAQTGITVANLDFRQAVDPEFGLGEAAEEIGFAAAGGAALAGITHGLGRLWQAALRRTRDGSLPPPPEGVNARSVADAANVVGRAAEIDAANPFPPGDVAGAVAHRRAVTEAMQDIVEGRTVDVRPIVAGREAVAPALDQPAIAAAATAPAGTPDVLVGEPETIVARWTAALTELRAAAVPPAPSRSLLGFVRAQGGLRKADLEGAEVAAVLRDVRTPPGFWNNKTGLNADAMAQRAWEAGYIGQAGGERPDLHAFYDALAREARGERVFAGPDADRAAAAAAARRDLDDILRRTGSAAGDSDNTIARKLAAAEVEERSARAEPTVTTRSARAGEFAEVIVQRGPRSPVRVTEHPDYAAAKNGDLEAAYRVVRDVIDPAVLARLEELTDSVEPGGAVVVAVDAGPGRNKLPRAYADELAARLGLAVTGDILQVSAAKRRPMGAWQRVTTGVEFDGPVHPGMLYILADDHVTMGATLADLAGYIESRGGVVRLATALSSTDEGPLLAASAETLEALRARHGTLEQWYRQRRGFGYEGLTDAEAKRLLSVRSTDTLRARIEADGGAQRPGEAGGDPAAGPGRGEPDDTGRPPEDGGEGGLGEPGRPFLGPDDAEAAVELAADLQSVEALHAEVARLLAERDVVVPIGEGGEVRSARELLAEADQDIAAAAEIAACAAGGTV